MIILDISSTSSTSSASLGRMPMAWLKATDPVIKETMESFRRRHRSKRVKFNCDEECEHDNALIVTDEEREFVWYTRREIHSMRTGAKEMVREKKVTRESESFSLRGLEDAASVRTSIEKKARKAAVLHSVLNEQERQMRLGAVDAEKLRRKSRMASKESVKIALRFAEQDAGEAMDHHDQNQGTWSRDGIDGISTQITSPPMINTSPINTDGRSTEKIEFSRSSSCSGLALPSSPSCPDRKGVNSSNKQHTKALTFVKPQFIKKGQFKKQQQASNDEQQSHILINHQRGIERPPSKELPSSRPMASATSTRITVEPIQTMLV